MTYGGILSLISIPRCNDATHPADYSYWLATESANIFKFQRTDFNVVSVTSANRAGIDYLQITVDAASYTGVLDNIITIFNTTYGVKYTGHIVTGFTTTVLETDILWVTSMAASLATGYVNDNTLYGGFYLEGRLVVNGDILPEQMNIIASPDGFGFIDLDVSGVLRVMTSLGKDGTYGVDPVTGLFDPDLALQKEETKSGNFILEYRTRWFGQTSDEAVNPYQTCCSPPMTWYYGEAVRSEEQGSNLHDYLPNVSDEEKFLNSFDQPVYFRSLPWDISFILPDTASATADVILSFFNSVNAPVSTVTYTVDITTDVIDGHIVSMSVDPASVPLTAVYFIAKIVV
jgi:hypothetical protein